MIYGYARVSTVDQNTERQVIALQEYGCEIIYQEKMSGTKKDRPELQELLNSIQTGDIVVVSELNRISRSLQDLLQLVTAISDKGGKIVSLKESWINADDIHGRLILQIFGALSEFERGLMLERMAEGISVYRSKGNVWGRPKKRNSRIDHALQLYDSGNYSMSEITEATGTARATIYRRLKERSQERDATA